MTALVFRSANNVAMSAEPVSDRNRMALVPFSFPPDHSPPPSSSEINSNSRPPSPLTAAACAVTGTVTDVREML